MQVKNTKKMSFVTTKVKKEFTSGQLTSYSGLSVISDFIKHIGLYDSLNEWFPTVRHNASLFSTAQVLSSIVLSNLCGVHRMSRMENFTHDPLVSRLPGLPKNIDEDTIRGHLSLMGERGAGHLHASLLKFNSAEASRCGLSQITLDCDSTGLTTYGNQQGAEAGYNPHKKGAKGYHPLLCFLSESKLLLNSWFRPGSAYTSNGILDFMNETLSALPEAIKRVFFRADSGFFNGDLFDLLEKGGHSYLVKVKLKNLKDLLQKQSWEKVDAKTATCKFTHRCGNWQKGRAFYGVRILREYVQKEFFGEMELIPVYDYFCYCSNLKGLDAIKIHRLYGERSESENWIEQAKNGLCAGRTITRDFWVNDILWQLSQLAYNISIMIRYVTGFWAWRQEHTTFRRWFICIPGKVVKSARRITVKMPKEYYWKQKWRDFEQQLACKIAV